MMRHAAVTSFNSHAGTKDPTAGLQPPPGAADAAQCKQAQRRCRGGSELPCQLAWHFFCAQWHSSFLDARRCRSTISAVSVLQLS